MGKLSQALMTMSTAAIAKLAERVRMDAWVNEATGFGTGRDKTTYGYILAPRVLADDELSALYHADDMAARMIDVVPQEMLREPFTIETGDPELDTLIADKFETLDVRSKMGDGIRWGRCYGGAALLIGADDGNDASDPLQLERVKDLSYLYCIDRRFLWPVDYYSQEGHPKFGQPSLYSVTALGGHAYSSTTVHESRLIIFRGAPTGTRERLQLASWDLSYLQRAYDVLRQFNTGWKSVETLLTDGNQAVFKMTGLSEMINSGGETALRTRLQVMELYRSVMRALVIDADSEESFERQSVAFSEIPATLDKFMLRLAAAVQIPVTILMGQSPAGMNATGESDFRWFYDRIRAEQTTTLAPKIRRLTKIWLGSKASPRKGKTLPDTLKVKFPPLWSETPLTAAQRRFAIAQGDAAYVTANVYTPDEIALQRGRPDGFENEIQLSDEGIKAREAALTGDLSRLVAGAPAGGEGDDQGADGGEGAAPVSASTAGATGPVVKELSLTASDLATITKVNEARESVGLAPLPGTDGDLTLPAFKAKYATTIAAATNADKGAPDGKPKPAFGGGGTRFDAAGPKPFELHRIEDETGVSGTGIVAEGCVFGDGTVALRWKTATPGTTIFESVDHMLSVHGHDGKTQLVYTDETRTDTHEVEKPKAKSRRKKKP